MRFPRRAGRLRRSDLVEVRSAAEILATLDRDGALEALPFMPEMVNHVGRRFRVSRRVEKLCDTAGGGFRSRRMRRTVLLDDIRCDGAGHDGCGAGCRLYWKEAWLRRVADGSEQSPPDTSDLKELEALATAGTKTTRRLEGEEVETYRCQATEAPAASEPLRGFDVRQYVREVECGNVGPLHALRVLGTAIVGRILRGRRPRGLPLGASMISTTPPRALGLQPGELVQIRSREEIAASLDARGKNRGLWFDAEMTPYCGGTYEVRSRVERFIDDRTGRMVELSSDCLILDGVTCSGERSSWRWFCPRAIYPWWREAWLSRVDDPDVVVPPSK